MNSDSSRQERSLTFQSSKYSSVSLSCSLQCFVYLPAFVEIWAREVPSPSRLLVLFRLVVQFNSDMVRIMQEYGSEVSNQTLPQRKQAVKKASIVRQFRRWNPEFFRFFLHVNGEWVPKLGREGELRRRAEKRRTMKQRGAVGNDGESTN